MCLYIPTQPHPRHWKSKRTSHAKHTYNSSPLLLLLIASFFLVRQTTMAAVATEAPFHVLAVDDSLPDRKLIERLLKTSSFQVTTVDSGSKALQFLGLGHDEDTPVAVHADQLVRNIMHGFLFTGSCCFLMKRALNFFVLRLCWWAGRCGEPDHHRLLHAWHDRIWSAQEDQGNLSVPCYNFLVSSEDKGVSWSFTFGLFNQESSSLRDIPVVIMSSENIPSRINRWALFVMPLFFNEQLKISEQ